MLHLAVLMIVPVSTSSGPAAVGEPIAGEALAFLPIASAVEPVATPAAAAEPAAPVAPVAAPAVREPWALEPLSASLLAEPRPYAIGMPVADALHQSRTTFKGGLYSSDNDELDDGWIANLSWMRFFTSILALELEVGYFDTDGEDSGIDAEVWGAPLMINGRVNLPVWILDLYAGAGVGTIYYDAEVTFMGLTAEDDGFLLGGNAFLGATINLAEAIALGVEAKYYVTEDIDDLDESLDALAVMLTLGFSR